MKLNKHSQQNNSIEISSTDLIVHDPAPSALNTLIHQSTHDDINASNPPLQQSHCHISENNHSDIVPKEETLADIFSNKSDSVHRNSKIFFAVLSLFLNACIEKTKPKALQVSRSAKNLLNISSDRDCSFGSENFKTSSYQGDEKLLLILILLPSSWMVINFLLKGLDQFAFLSDKEHIFFERAPTNNQRAEAAWLSLSSKGGILIPVEENQNHEIHAQAEKVENSKVKGGPLTRSKSRSVQQDVAHPHFQ